MGREAFFDDFLAEISMRIRNAKSELEKCTGGALGVEHRSAGTMYFHVTMENGKRRRRFINERPELIAELTRKAYLKKEIDILEKNRELILRIRENFNSKYTEPTIENVCAMLRGKYQPESYLNFYEANLTGGEGRKSPPDAHKDNFFNHENRSRGEGEIARGRYSREIFEWANQPYTRSTYKEENLRHRTSRGLMLRSKSEVAIAEQLYTFEIPFRSEEVLKRDGIVLVPDFVVPDVKGRLYIWEHAGMMDNPEYARRHKYKMEAYEKIGVVPWKNLIVTYDNEYGDINVATIRGIIESRLL